ncbi:LysM peptidoglycan-binding domain-containing protein [Spirochaetota bacterium]
MTEKDMVKKYICHIFSIIISAIFVFSFYACEKPIPSEVLAQAKLELSKAEEVEAQKYAPEKYKQASELLVEAMKLTQAENLEGATQKANESMTASKEAYLKAIEKKAEIEIEEIGKNDQLLQTEKAPKYFPDDYKSFTGGWEESKDFYAKKDFVNCYKKAVETNLFAKEILNKIGVLKEETLSAIDDAEIVIKDAMEIGALKYSPEDMNAAEKLLEEAKGLFENKEYHDAKEKAQQAMEIALKAKEKALEELQKGKKAMAASLLGKARKAYADAKAFADRNKSDNDIQSDLAVIGDTLKKAEDAFKQNDFDGSNGYCNEVIRLAQILLGKSTGKTYTVRLMPQKRDCLWRIAEYNFIYTDPFKWPLIWKANVDQIEDPDLIYPGQVFKIP